MEWQLCLFIVVAAIISCILYIYNDVAISKIMSTKHCMYNIQVLLSKNTEQFYRDKTAFCDTIPELHQQKINVILTDDNLKFLWTYSESKLPLISETNISENLQFKSSLVTRSLSGGASIRVPWKRKVDGHLQDITLYVFTIKLPNNNDKSGHVLLVHHT